LATTMQSPLDQIRKLLPDYRALFPFQNVNDVHDESMTVGQKIADGVARNMGSWRFIIIQSTILLMWISANAAFALHDYAVSGFNLKSWDPYPFILLNLALSFQAAYAAPFIMMSQNRQADKDRLAAEHDYHVNIRSEAKICSILDHLKAQDDVILAILHQMESQHGVKAGKGQVEAERRLADLQHSEEQAAVAYIREQEKKAGLEAEPVPVAG
jgi:uncharacterized membrane protein